MYNTAVERLKSIGIEVVTHVIAGLPGETKKDFLTTVEYVASKKSDGIKLVNYFLIYFPNFFPKNIFKSISHNI